MENPATWNEVEKAIDEAISEHEKAMQEGVCGISIVRRIYNKLIERGYKLT